MKNNSLYYRLFISLLILSIVSGAHAEPELREVQGHVPAAVSRLKARAHYERRGQMQLAIGLPVTDPSALKVFLDDLYNPSSPQYHQYLTPDQFTARFGPSADAYQKVIQFAQSNHLQITGKHSNRMLLEVKATVSEIEKVFHVRLNTYQHPTENRTFFAPDREPSIPAGVPILHISGLDNFQLPKSRLKNSPSTNTVTRVGTGPGNKGYMGKDFRNAYVPGVTNTGAGQTVALLEFDGYNATDITQYKTYAHITNNIILSRVLLNGFNGSAGNNNSEVALDIEMAMAMAPGLTRIVVYEEAYPYNDAPAADILLNRIATDNSAKQISCSWVVPLDATSEQIFQQYASQGQTFFSASGDSGAMVGDIVQPSDDPYIIQVGGTTLTTLGAGGPWLGEVVWNNNGGGSSGGVSHVYPIPSWQTGVDLTGTGGSTSFRNFPDVSLVADNGQPETVGGTSCSAPLWAGINALINQQAAATGKPSVGFLAPAIYRLYSQNNYTSNFHDIYLGNSVISNSVQQFQSLIGYDLCTGVGTPIGNVLMNSLLASPDPLLITPQSTLYMNGPAGGPFNVTSGTLTITNTSSSSLNWAVINPYGWLSVSSTNGVLAAHGSVTNFGVALNAGANGLSAGTYDATLWFTNLTTHIAQSLHVALTVGPSLPLNGGFEEGDFFDWILTGDNGANNFVDDGTYTGFTSHTGFYFMTMGEQSLPMATLFQQMPTFAGQPYSLTFYLLNPDSGFGTSPNEFSVSWNGTTLYDQANVATLNSWTRMKYNVLATNTLSTVTFGAYNTNTYFAIDDVSLTALPQPTFVSRTLSGSTLNLTWSTINGFNYQLQSSTNLSANNWINVGPLSNATSSTQSGSDTVTPNSRNFYRVILQP